jgi:hypothetical protein
MSEIDYLKEQFESQRRLQDDQIDSQQRVYAPQLKEQIAEAQAAVIAQTNPAKALKIIIRGFQGFMIDEDGEEKKIGSPLMNDLGISKISSYLIPFINDPARLGNIKEQEARSMTLRIVDDITIDVGINWREYGITSPTIKDIIVDSCLMLVLVTLSRSVEGKEKRFLSSIIVESLSQRQQEKKKENWLDKISLGIK